MLMLLVGGRHSEPFGAGELEICAFLALCAPLTPAFPMPSVLRPPQNHGPPSDVQTLAIWGGLALWKNTMR